MIGSTIMEILSFAHSVIKVIVVKEAFNMEDNEICQIRHFWVLYVEF